MEFLDFQRWADALGRAWNTPQAVIPLLLLIAVIAFWFGLRKASIDKATLTQEARTLRQQLESANQRLALASEKQRHIMEQLQEADIEFANLQFRISELAATPPPETTEMLAASSELMATTVRSALSANEALREILTPQADS